MNNQIAEVQLTYKPIRKNKEKIYTSADSYRLIRPTFSDGTIQYREFFKVIFLNSALEVLGWTLISQGGISNTLVDVRLVFQAALLANATGVILVHNHPSGKLKPSREDDLLTAKIQNAGKVLDIRVLDHLIISDEHYYSYNDESRL